MDELDRMLLEEIRLNREQMYKMAEAQQADHHELLKLLDSKVSRGELLGWLGLLSVGVGTLGLVIV